MTEGSEVSIKPCWLLFGIELWALMVPNPAAQSVLPLEPETRNAAMSASHPFWHERVLPVVVLVLFYVLTFPPVALLQPARPMMAGGGGDWFQNYRAPYLWLRQTPLANPLKAYEKWWQQILDA